MIGIAGVLCSCATSKDIAYFQDINSGESHRITNTYTNVIKSGDLLSIMVSSIKPELAVPYNLSGVRNQLSSSLRGTVDTNVRQEMEGYLVNQSGNIDFPVLGTLHVAGMTRQELSDMLKDSLKNVVPDPVVTVNFLNFKITVIGEVTRPGTFNVQGDRLSILEAIGLAGDLTVYGKRGNVLVIRENNGVREYARLDLKSKKIFESEYFYLQQNDVICVEPVNAKARSISSFNNNFPTIVSLGSLFTSIAMSIFYLSR